MEFHIGIAIGALRVCVNLFSYRDGYRDLYTDGYRELDRDRYWDGYGDGYRDGYMDAACLRQLFLPLQGLLSGSL